ncbi:hypothetical protein GGI12_000961 [Dipsacomyces acuminosporus]|nr:hypothetical protein GGI12_000961 [Dipsacomyces acuminosporus]
MERPTFLGIHTRDESTQVLYVSSGCRLALGFTPEYIVARRAKDFIADPYDSDYPQIYASRAGGEETPEDEANAYVMYMNIKTASGTPVLHRITTFKCDNCIIVVGMAFPEVPFQGRHELEVQMLDGAMKKLNITRQRELDDTAVRKRRSEASSDQRAPLYRSGNRQIKAAFVLENPLNEETEETGRRQNGPLIVFVTGSVSCLIDADTSDLVRYPFLRLVAPEDMLKAGRFFDKLSDSPDVLFETFSLLQRPYLIDGDIRVSNAQNDRVLVECLGANVQDGVALLLRKLCTKRPFADSSSHSSHSSITLADDECGYMSLEDIVSSDPETSDAPEWTRLR